MAVVSSLLGRISGQNRAMYPKAFMLLALMAGLFACGSERALQGQISVASSEDGDWEIYLVNVGNQRAYRLSENRAYDSGLVWSPDGRSSVRTTEWVSGETKELLTLDEDGLPQVEITEVTGDRELLRTNLDGTEQFLTENNVPDQSPAWSPDGNQIAFVSELTGDYEIHVMDADGSDVRQLTASPREDWQPSWSPDGKHIVFTSVRTGDWEIYVMDSDGANVHQLTERPGVDWTPDWSPDGQQIVFASNGIPGVIEVADEAVLDKPETTPWDIYVMNPDGSSVKRLTDDPGNDIEPTWSPDGKYIAFASDRSGPLEVYVMNADGSDQEGINWSGIPSDWTEFD